METVYRCDIAHSSSGILPDSRRAYWPCDIAPMAEVFDIQEVRAQIARLMERDQIKRKPLAKAAGLGETAIRDIFDEERNDLRVSTLVKLADHFAVSVDVIAGRAPVQLVGKIGAGGSIIFEELSDPPTVPRPPLGTGTMIALEVVGESMLPKYEPGDVIYIRRDHDGLLPEYLGEYCAVRLADGSTFLKILSVGTDAGRFTLRSLNAADMVDVEVEWATPVLFVMPKRSRGL
jgi:Peptidase S24-like